MKYDKEVVFAAEYIRTIAQGKPIESEIEVSFNRDGKEATFGTFDAYSDGHLFDLKTGREKRYYLPQMAVYVAAICQRDGIDQIEVHLIYSALNKVDKFTLTREEAEAVTHRIMDAVNNPTRQPSPCEYCAWCAHKGSCTALNETALAVSKSELIAGVDISTITDPETMGKFREVADMVEVWAKEVKSHCSGFSEIGGYMKVSRKGKKVITDITGALIHSGLPSEKFIKACTISYPKLLKQFAAHTECSDSKEADKKLSELVSSVTTIGRPVEYWRKEK